MRIAQTLCCTAVFLAGCTTPEPQPMPTTDLPLFGDGYRAEGDQCRSVGENDYTNQFLGDASDLVACPSDYEGIGVFVSETNAVQVDTVPGYLLYSVPRR